MALAHSPRIVTDGLVLALDAGNTKSYPGSGTTWSDLIGSNNGTISGATNSASGVGWDIPNISGHSTTTNFDGDPPTSQDNFIRDNGTDLFLLGYYGIIYHYSLATAFNVNSTATLVRSLDLKGTSGTGFSANAQDFRSFTFSPDGLNVYVRGDDSSIRISQFSLATAFDLSSTKTHVGNFTSFPSAINDSRSVRFANNGSILMLGGNNSDHRFGISQLSTPYNITTVSSTTVYDLADDFSYTDRSNYWVHGSNYSSDGKKLIISSVYGYELIYIQLSTAFDPSSNTSTNTYSSDDIASLHFISDGSKAISERNASSGVEVYNTGTPASDVVPGTHFIFDGTDDYITVNDVTGVTDFSISNDYTVDFWVYLSSTQNNTESSDNDVVEKWSGSGGYPYSFRYIRSNQTMSVNTYNDTSQISTSIQISSNNWWNICGVFDWTNSVLTVYGNGGSVSSTTTLNLTGTITNTSALNLMRRGSSNNYATGKLSNLKIYDKALTEAEVKQNYNALKGRYV